jgi:hypothetical protein
VKRLFFFAFCLAATPLASQDRNAGGVLRFAPGAEAYAYTPWVEPLSAFPQSWRDSVINAFARWLAPRTTALPQPFAGGEYAELSLRILRSGDVYRVRLVDPLENPVADSMLVAAAWLADEALAFPPFPAGVPGAGTDLRIRINVPRRGERASGLESLVDAPRSRSTPHSKECDSVLAMPNGSRETTLWLVVDSTPGSTVNGTWARTAMAQVAEHFPRPLAASLGQRPRVLAENPASDAELPTWLRLQFDPTGKLVHVHPVEGSGYAVIDSALLNAIDRSAAEGMFPPPPSTRNDLATVDLSLAVGRAPSAEALRLGTVVLHLWLADRPPTLRTPGSATSSRRPPGQGRVTFEFVVGTDGLPIPGTFQVISSSSRDLSDVAHSIATTSRYLPGQLGGCPIPVRVRQVVSFETRPVHARDVQTERPIGRP